MNPTLPPRFLRLPEVCSRTGLGRDSIYRIAKHEPLLRPVKLSRRASGWLESSVTRWCEERVASGGHS